MAEDARCQGWIEDGGMQKSRMDSPPAKEPKPIWGRRLLTVWEEGGIYLDRNGGEGNPSEKKSLQED